MPVSNFGNLAYRTLRSNANYDNQDKTRRFLHGDLLTVSLGYMGTNEISCYDSRKI